MIANYHTHTWRCRHADGTEREYVERTIEGGLKILGFSDHSPYPFPDGYDSGMRMRLDQVEGYVDTVLALKKEYDKDIEIHLGLETEYFPRFWDQLIDFLSDYPFEYFVQLSFPASTAWEMRSKRFSTAAMEQQTEAT